MRFGKLDIDPAKNPAVLDTATWNHHRAWEVLGSQRTGFWRDFGAAAVAGRRLLAAPAVTPHEASRASWQGGQFCLATLADGQQILLEVGAGSGRAVLGQPLGSLSFGEGEQDAVSAYPTNLSTVAAYVQSIDSAREPRALGARPRLGLGSRMTTASWPGVYRAMAELAFAANAIQNSMRELSVLDDLLAGRPGEPNYGPNLGTFASGHTGSSFEGLWLYGVLEALKAPSPIAYGAEADHIQVKRGVGGLARARRVLDSARHYTFFTLDVSDILQYQALAAGPGDAISLLERKIPNSRDRHDILAYHSDTHRLDNRSLRMDDVAVGRFVARHWDALDAMEDLARHVGRLRGGQPYDLEFAIDEVPAGLSACECITSSEELLFVVRECRRRGIPLSHVAPNVGVEKEVDYRCPDGLVGMAARIREQTQLAREVGLMLDFHSGDDLTRETRRAIGRATEGHCHFKLSPSLQLLFAETLADVCPGTFRVWWDDTLAFARREAEAGSPLAQAGLQLLGESDDPAPSAQHQVFRHYCFASVGRRDDHGQFVHREMFYHLPQEFHTEYGGALQVFIGGVADDLFGQV